MLLPRPLSHHQLGPVVAGGEEGGDLLLGLVPNYQLPDEHISTVQIGRRLLLLEES